VALPMAGKRPRLRWWVERYHFTMAASAFLVAVGTLVRASGPGAEMLVAWASASWLFYLAFGLALYRGAQSGYVPRDPSTAGMRIAA
jgi:hypothetical protein